MKCVKHIQTGDIDRVPDEEARRMVREMPEKYVLVPKHEWKTKYQKKEK